MFEQERWWRKDAITTKIGNITIDTCFTPDTEKWETGIKRDGNWIVVEMYKDKEEAIKGHIKWVKKIIKNPKIKLKRCIDAIDWALGNY